MNPTVLRPSAKSWLTTARNTMNPVALETWKAKPMPSPSAQAVDREGGRPEGPDLRMGMHVLVVVAVMEHERPCGHEEHEEADTCEPPDVLGVSEIGERLRQDVEERDPDDHAPGQRDQHADAAPQPEREQTAGERRHDGAGSERDRDPGHVAHLEHTP